MSQDYETRVGDEFVIIGNDVLMKCDFPGFASDQLQVVGWNFGNPENQDEDVMDQVTGGSVNPGLRRIVRLSSFKTHSIRMNSANQVVFSENVRQKS